MDETPPREFQELLAVARGYQRSRAVTVAAELGIADMLRDGPRGAEELATATGTHAPTLSRLLRALASIGIFVEGADRRFELGATGQYLRRDHPLSAADLELIGTTRATPTRHVIEAMPGGSVQVGAGQSQPRCSKTI